MTRRGRNSIGLLVMSSWGALTWPCSDGCLIVSENANIALDFDSALRKWGMLARVSRAAPAWDTKLFQHFPEPSESALLTNSLCSAFDGGISRRVTSAA